MTVAGNPACPDQAAAERAVNEVWESCFNDTRPFDEVGVRLTPLGAQELTDPLYRFIRAAGGTI